MSLDPWQVALVILVVEQIVVGQLNLLTFGKRQIVVPQSLKLAIPTGKLTFLWPPFSGFAEIWDEGTPPSRRS